jgi:glycogen debranching enzyme
MYLLSVSAFEILKKLSEFHFSRCRNICFPEYISSRIIVKESTRELGLYVQKLFQNIGELPRYLVPTYFDQAFKRLYALCIEHALNLMGAQNKSEFSKRLALTSLQFVGIAEGGALPAGGSYHNCIEDGKPFIAYSLSAGN